MNWWVFEEQDKGREEGQERNVVIREIWSLETGWISLRTDPGTKQKGTQRLGVLSRASCVL